jgi:membrane associated rhomboid family serine protease
LSSATSEAVEPTPTPPPVPVPRPPPPLFSWIYLGVCVLVFLPHAVDVEPPNGFLLYGPAIAAGEWWRVLTSAVEHVSPFHILANGLSIWSFGTVLERQIGSVRMFVASLVTALTSAAGALGFLWFFPSAGASGVICGWLGLALLIFGGRAQKVLVQWAILIVLISLIPRVSWAAHLGGFVGGLVLGLMLRAGLRVRPNTPFWLFDRLAIPAIAIAAGVVWIVVRAHAGLGGRTL